MAAKDSPQLRDDLIRAVNLMIARRQLPENLDYSLDVVKGNLEVRFWQLDEFNERTGNYKVAKPVDVIAGAGPLPIVRGIQRWSED